MFDVRDVPGPDANARLRLPHEFPVELAGQRFAVLDRHNTLGSDCPGDVALPVGMAAARMPLLHGLVSALRRFGVAPAIHLCHPGQSGILPALGHGLSPVTHAMTVRAEGNHPFEGLDPPLVVIRSPFVSLDRSLRSSSSAYSAIGPGACIGILPDPLPVFGRQEGAQIKAPQSLRHQPWTDVGSLAVRPIPVRDERQESVELVPVRHPALLLPVKRGTAPGCFLTAPKRDAKRNECRQGNHHKRDGRAWPRWKEGMSRRSGYMPSMPTGGPWIILPLRGHARVSPGRVSRTVLRPQAELVPVSRTGG